jgi:hypothetical protein
MRSVAHVVAALAIAASACGQGVLSVAPGGKGGSPSPTGGSGGSTGGSGGSNPPTCSGDGCQLLECQSLQIRRTYCADCHEAPNNFGTPPFDYVLDDDKLTDPAHPSSTGWPEVIPGDPARSVLYQRVAKGDMPPVGGEPTMPTPRPSQNDITVLHDWIICLGAGQTGSGGTGGGGGGGGGMTDAGVPPLVEGQVVPCPQAVPAGPCTVPQTCEYPTGTCVCQDGGWVCTSCPPAQPMTGASCEPYGEAPIPPLRCLYGNVTCWCSAIYGGWWGCGVCPSAPPAAGGACGNILFACDYGTQTCACSSDRWRCYPNSCPPAGDPFSNFICGDGVYTCAYPDEDQFGGCAAIAVPAPTTCPRAAPAEGATCLTSVACQYSDISCECGSGRWQCMLVCPPAQPTNGAACSSSLNCTYDGGNTLCYCMNGTWHC